MCDCDGAFQGVLHTRVKELELENKRMRIALDNAKSSLRVINQQVLKWLHEIEDQEQGLRE